jgi:predicted dehydrogenase
VRVQLPFFPAVQLAKRLIEQGVMGNLYCFNGSYCQDQGADDRVPAEKLWYAMGPKASGAAIGIGSHLIDMSRFLMGEVASVSGIAKTYNKVHSSASGDMLITTDEEMLGVAEFTSSASGLYRASAVAGGRKNYLAWEINGFTAVNVTQPDRGHPLMESLWPRGHVLGWEDAHVNEIAHMLDAVSNDGQVAPLGATFADGLRVVSIIEAIKRFHASGKRAYLD